MQKSAYVRVMIAGLLLAGLGSASACGSSDGDDESDGGSAGNSGATGKGGSGGTTTGPVECGGEMCAPLVLPVEGAPPVEACCAQDDVCGLDSSVLEAFGPTFEERCQPRDQPGERDPACPNSTSTTLDGGFMIEFDGCCRANGRCGYMLDSVLGVYQIGLGCVDSEPFLNGETPATCGDGAGGAPGEGGAPSSTGPGGASGAPSAPGAGGVSGSPSAPSAGAGGA
jgi:hypothetical protein